MNAVTRVRFDHLAKLLIAADTTQLSVSEPLPRRALLFQVIKESFRARNEGTVFSVRPQTHVNPIEIAFSRNTRERGDHQFDQTRIGFVLRQRFDRRRNEGVISDQDVKIRTVIDTACSESSESVKRDAWTTAKRTITTRHLAPRDEISDVHACDGQVGL